MPMVDGEFEPCFKCKHKECLSTVIPCRGCWEYGEGYTKFEPMFPDESKLTEKLVFIEKLIRKARKSAIEAYEAERVVFEFLGGDGLRLDGIPSEAENANNLEEAISCYINYEEYSVHGLIKEIRKAYEKREECL